MRKSIFLISGALFISIILGSSLFDQARSREMRLIKVGDFFPEIHLQVPQNSKERMYLGLSEAKTFTLKDVKAALILVEILSVYCVSCQRQTPAYNKLYELIEKDPQTKGRVKILGIAAGNGDLEVKDFHQRYKVPFPIIPDPGFVMHAAIGGSRTPFSIYVRKVPPSQMGLVAGTHLGTNYRYEQLLDELASLMTVDLAAIHEKGRKTEAKSIYVKPILTGEQVEGKVKAAFGSLNGKLSQFEMVPLKSSGHVYTGLVEREGQKTRLFAEVVSRPSACDLCHDVHFIYMFDVSGKVMGFVPLQLTKYGNKPWSEADIAKMRSRIVGKHLFKPFIFDHEVDAVSSATITSAQIFNSLSKGEALMKELKGKGLI